MIDLAMLNKIGYIANYYSKKSQLAKAKEELMELQAELYQAANPFGWEDILYLPDNTWSECADVIIMCLQLAIQHDKLGKVQEQINFKLDRQMERIEQEGKNGY